MLTLASWNVDPNRVWWVRLSDSGSGISAEVYLTQADAEAQTSLQASGESAGYGTGVEITLTNDPGATEPVSIFQEAYDWHLLASGAASDPVQYYEVREFVTLDDISDPIYRNEDLITSRTTAEIDAHTHATLSKDLELGSHIPTLEPGDIVQVTSTRRGKTELLQVMEHRITGTVSDGGEMSLTSSLTAYGYLQLKR